MYYVYPLGAQSSGKLSPRQPLLCTFLSVFYCKTTLHFCWHIDVTCLWVYAYRVFHFQINLHIFLGFVDFFGVIEIEVCGRLHKLYLST